MGDGMSELDGGGSILCYPQRDNGLLLFLSFGREGRKVRVCVSTGSRRTRGAAVPIIRQWWPQWLGEAMRLLRLLLM
jgi:hypothetical protein